MPFYIHFKMKKIILLKISWQCQRCFVTFGKDISSLKSYIIKISIYVEYLCVMKFFFEIEKLIIFVRHYIRLVFGLFSNSLTSFFQIEVLKIFNSGVLQFSQNLVGRKTFFITDESSANVGVTRYSAYEAIFFSNYLTSH